jgi:hypothetical protein
MLQYSKFWRNISSISESRVTVKATVPVGRVPLGEVIIMFLRNGYRTISSLCTMDVFADEKVERPEPVGGSVKTPSIVAICVCWYGWN